MLDAYTVDIVLLYRQFIETFLGRLRLWPAKIIDELTGIERPDSTHAKWFLPGFYTGSSQLRIRLRP